MKYSMTSRELLESGIKEVEDLNEALRQSEQVKGALDSLLRANTIERDEALEEVKRLKKLLFEMGEAMPNTSYDRRRLKLVVKKMEMESR